VRLDFSLKEPKERTLEERQREIRSDFQAGRSVVVVGAIVAVFGGGRMEVVRGFYGVPRGLWILLVYNS
jgi:hypothetical protein